MKTLKNLGRLAVMAAALIVNQQTNAATWTYTGSISTGRYFHTGTLLPNGKVLVAGGATATGNANIVATAELYDPATGLWTATGTMASARAFPIAVLLENGNVLLAGGAQSLPSGVTSTAEFYNPATGLWRSWSNPSSQRSLEGSGRPRVAMLPPQRQLWSETGKTTNQGSWLS